MKFALAAAVLVWAGLATTSQAAGPGVVIFQMTGNQNQPSIYQQPFGSGQYIFDIVANKPVHIDLDFQYEYRQSWFLIQEGGGYVDCYGDDQSRGEYASSDNGRLKFQIIIPEARTEAKPDLACGPNEGTPMAFIYYSDLSWRAYFAPLSGGDDLTYSMTVEYVANPVPEPATWVLLIAGLGAAGVALRRRRPVSA